MSLTSFGVRKPVPVNLLMIAILFGGAVLGLSLRREFFPESDPEQALVSMPFPGATPVEVEDGLAKKVEDALIELDEIKEIRTTLAENGGGITIQFREGINVDDAMDEVERTIESLTDLPDESDAIELQLFEPKLPVIMVVVYGDMDERVMKQAMYAIRDDLRSLDNMGETLISGVRNYEVSIDVKRDELLRHNLSLPQVSEAVRAWMIEVPGGTVRTKSGNVNVRAMGIEERVDAVGDIVVKGNAQGSAVRLRDIAVIEDSFVDEQLIMRFGGKPAAMLTVFKVGKQDIVRIAEMVRAYVDGRNGKPFDPNPVERVATSDRKKAYELGSTSQRALPENASVATTSDLARFVEGRLDLLVRNAGYGAVLVILTLLLILNWRAAMWVGMGLLTAIMGTLLAMAVFDVTLNLLTMFGLIVVLGLLVDDAIVVAENIQARHDKGEPALLAATRGTDQVMWPVVATVLTSVVAFLPLTFVKGQMGTLLGALPAVVACALMMSLVESILILPSHMGHTLAKRDRSKPGRVGSMIARYETWRDHWLHDRIIPLYGRVLAGSLKYRYITTAVVLAAMLISIGMIRPAPNGRVKFEFLSKDDAETIVVDIHMPIGTPIEKTNEIVQRVEEAAQQQKELKSISAVIGKRDNLDTGQADAFSTHVAQMYIELQPVEQRDRESATILQAIRDALEGKMDEVERLGFSEITGGPSGPGITIRVSGEHDASLAKAAETIKTALAGFDGVNEIADDHNLGQLELRIQLKSGAGTLGFTTANIATQVRGFLFGIDAHVFAANEEDIDVRVRLDEASRQSLFTIENSWVLSPSNVYVPLSEVADITDSSTYSSIKRVNGQRAITVTAETSPAVAPEAIMSQLDLKAIGEQFPDVTIKTAGRQERMADAFSSLPLGFMAAMVMVYVILAWLFSSYLQPLVVMSVIPFAIIGAIWGHWLLGYSMTFLSMIGFVALSGIVVNDSLILVEFYNHRRAKGIPVRQALIESGRARFRAILLTTVTTVLGLTPLILEQSFQAKFLIPMAVAIAFGLMSATFLVLLILPCFLMILDDVKRTFYFLWHGRKRPEVEPQTSEIGEAVTA